MDLSIQDWGAIGELLGAIAVFATLAYLAIQIRQSNELSERNQKIAIGQAYQMLVSLVLVLDRFQEPLRWNVMKEKLGYNDPASTWTPAEPIQVTLGQPLPPEKPR